MLNILRKLRRDRMNGKYLKYAIGEIVLVVIGILIALGINNWNEDRKARHEQVTILENLKGDLFADTLDLEYNLAMHKTFYRAEEELLHFLQSEEPYQKDTLEFSDALSTPLITLLHNSTFGNIRNNEAGLISNNDLRNRIFRYYDFFNRALPVLENESEVHQTYSAMKPYFLKYFNLKKNQERVGDYDSNSDEYFDQVFKKHLLAFSKPGPARRDEAFKIELGESIYFRKVKIDFYVEVLKRIKVLSLEIDQELTQLQ